MRPQLAIRNVVQCNGGVLLKIALSVVSYLHLCSESRDVLRFSQVHGLFLGAEHVGRGGFLHRLQEVQVFQCSSGDLAGPEG